MKKIKLQERKECYLCRQFGIEIALSSYGLHRHHVFFGTANRKKSEEYGMVVWLCPDHHTNGELAVHRCIDADMVLKQASQREFEKVYSREHFVEVFGKSWI